MEGPYRDLGSGFARLTGLEGLRRGPSRISSVEDALYEMLKNASEAGANNIFVASHLSRRRYRTLLLLDDGEGIPESYEKLIFEPGVTSRHLPAGGPRQTRKPTDGSGLPLHHIREKALSASVVNASNPTSIKTTFDTTVLPESSMQSNSRNSKSNLEATAREFAAESKKTLPQTKVYLSSPARILATLSENRIIPQTDPGRFSERARSLGFDLSLRTLQRIKRGDVPLTKELSELQSNAIQSGRPKVDYETRDASGLASPKVVLDGEDLAEIAAVLARSASKSYLEIGDVSYDCKAGKVNLHARLYEPEEEYE